MRDRGEGTVNYRVKPSSFSNLAQFIRFIFIDSFLKITILKICHYFVIKFLSVCPMNNLYRALT